MNWFLQLPRIEHFPRDRSNTKAYLHQKRHMKPSEMDMHAISLGNLKPAVLACSIRYLSLSPSSSSTFPVSCWLSPGHSKFKADNLSLKVITMPGNPRRVVICVDFGTTFSGVAWVQVSNVSFLVHSLVHNSQGPSQLTHQIHTSPQPTSSSMRGRMHRLWHKCAGWE